MILHKKWLFAVVICTVLGGMSDVTFAMDYKKSSRQRNLDAEKAVFNKAIAELNLTAAADKAFVDYLTKKVNVQWSHFGNAGYTKNLAEAKRLILVERKLFLDKQALEARKHSKKVSNNNAVSTNAAPVDSIESSVNNEKALILHPTHAIITEPIMLSNQERIMLEKTAVALKMAPGQLLDAALGIKVQQGSAGVVAFVDSLVAQKKLSITLPTAEIKPVASAGESVTVAVQAVTLTGDQIRTIKNACGKLKCTPDQVALVVDAAKRVIGNPDAALKFATIDRAKSFASAVIKHANRIKPTNPVVESKTVQSDLPLQESSTAAATTADVNSNSNVLASNPLMQEQLSSGLLMSSDSSSLARGGSAQKSVSMEAGMDFDSTDKEKLTAAALELGIHPDVFIADARAAKEQGEINSAQEFINARTLSKLIGQPNQASAAPSGNTQSDNQDDLFKIALGVPVPADDTDLQEPAADNNSGDGKNEGTPLKPGSVPGGTTPAGTGNSGLPNAGVTWLKNPLTYVVGTTIIPVAYALYNIIKIVKNPVALRNHVECLDNLITIAQQKNVVLLQQRLEQNKEYLTVISAERMAQLHNYAQQGNFTEFITVANTCRSEIATVIAPVVKTFSKETAIKLLKRAHLGLKDELQATKNWVAKKAAAAKAVTARA